MQVKVEIEKLESLKNELKEISSEVFQVSSLLGLNELMFSSPDEYLTRLEKRNSKLFKSEVELVLWSVGDYLKLIQNKVNSINTRLDDNVIDKFPIEE